MKIAVGRASEKWEAVAAMLGIDSSLVQKDAQKLLLDTYIDDGCTGGSAADVDRMQGSLKPNGQFSGTIPALVNSVGLKLKTMVRSGSKDKEAMAKLSLTVLGYNWGCCDIGPRTTCPRGH